MPAEHESSVVQMHELTVDDSQAGERVDRYVAVSLPDQSRSHIQQLMVIGAITLNGRVPKPSERVKAGDLVSVSIPLPQQTLVATSIPLTVVYEDDDVLVIDKPAGLVVHPAPGHASDTLVNALVALYPSLRIGNSLRPGIVHRLDKGTSGLMVVAKHDRAMASLVDQMKERTVVKEYLALVEGCPSVLEGVIDAPIGRSPEERMRMAVVDHGREARTHFALVERIGRHSLLRLRLETGRTHQIRVHLAAIGHPIEGDAVYGRRQGDCCVLGRQFLHAEHLAFLLPLTDTPVSFRSRLPADLQACLDELRQDNER